MGKNLFDNVMIVLSTIVVVGLLFYIPRNFDFLNPVGKALSDVDMTDMVFSQFREDEASHVDTNVVIVNIGQSSREEIARILQNINRHDPMAVGVDVFFRKPKEPTSDSILAAALAATKNLVMVSKVSYKEDLANEDLEAYDKGVDDEERDFDTLELSHPMFMEGASSGFANLVVDQDAAFMTCREVSFKERCAGTDEYSFPIRLVQIVDPAAAERALQRGTTQEIINYHGNTGAFYNVDVDQALDPEVDLSFVKDKIVLLGYVGPDFATKSLEDNFFTPLNEQYVGRSYPDMHGIVIHANVISMIRKGNFIGRMSTEMSFIVGFFVLVCNVMLFTYVYTHHDAWYDVVAVSLQLGQSLLGLFLIIYVFNHYHYKLALTPTIVGVALVGTVHDLYQDSLKKIILGFVRRLKNVRSSHRSSLHSE